jgi:hypothetical protein
MLMALAAGYFTASAIITTALIAACALSGREQKVQGSLFDEYDFAVVAMPAIAEVQLPMRQLPGPLSTQQV